MTGFMATFCCDTDDEPVDGPTCYFIMTGFSSLDVLRELAPVGITAHVLMKITGGTAPPETQTNGVYFYAYSSPFVRIRIHIVIS